VAYGSTNKYKPVNSRRKRGGSGEYVTQGGVWPRIRNAKLAITVSVKTMDNQRWI
jgi:hypothetical protein